MLFNKFYDTNWVLAIRKKDENTPFFLSNKKSKFNIIKNPWRYWCADPFLFEYNGKTFIFCEAFDIFRDKGVIAYRYIKENGKFSKLHPCLDLPYHLSYPFIFKHDNEIYMIPETGSINEIQLYKATKFPDKWEKQKVLLKNTSACDTNLLVYNGETYMFTLIFDKSQSPYIYNELFVFLIKDDKFIKLPFNPAINNSEMARNGGNFISYNNDLYRVAQNCSNMYGENLNFLKITNLSPASYEEVLIKKIKLNDILLNNNKIYDGIHTYNNDNQYEIIDLQIERCFRIERVIYLILNKFKNIIGRFLKK